MILKVMIGDMSSRLSLNLSSAMAVELDIIVAEHHLNTIKITIVMSMLSNRNNISFSFIFSSLLMPTHMRNPSTSSSFDVVC